MGNGKSKDKIGIGPEGRMGALIQFILISLMGTLIFVYAVSPEWIVLTALPGTLIMLIMLAVLALLGDGWPLAPPAGNWNPAKSRVVSGIGMTLIWAICTTAMTLFMMFVFPKWQMGPLYLWFGAIGFWCTLLYGINWNGWPFKGHMHPWGVAAAGFIVIIIVTTLIWNFLTNLDGTPFADTPMNHRGPFNVNWLTGYIVWSIAGFFIFSPVFTTQGAPFTKWGHPGAAIGQTIIAHILGYLCWSGSLALGMSPTFSFGAVASSIIFWALVYSWHFQFWGITKLTHGARAFAAVLVILVLAAVWIAVCYIILGPVARNITALKLPADINLLIIYLNLCILGPALLSHNAFWLRWPLTLPAPPGTPPADQSA
ncbi:MAG: hypothetical protein C0392_15490 [Syntrophus sp. (in: bacteria)]|nr:hypothetical protein [Syntrophus sp. (in: bacteria)]